MVDFVKMREQFVSLLLECGREPSVAEAEADRMVESERRGLANADRVLNAWCGCDPQPGAEDTEYYLRPNGAHGWFHPKCGGITQTG